MGKDQKTGKGKRKVKLKGPLFAQEGFEFNEGVQGPAIKIHHTEDSAIDFDAVDRRVYWVTADGRALRPTEMEDRHLINTVHYCLRSVGATTEKIKWINESFGQTSVDVRGMYQTSYRLYSPIEGNESDRWRAASRTWPTFDALVTEAIRRGLIPNPPIN